MLHAVRAHNMSSELSKVISTSFVQIDGDTVRCAVNNLAEAKVAMKELKLKKKEFRIRKREIVAQQREIRAAYTHDVRNRGSMLRGGGGFGRFIRAFQTASRDSKRAGLANDLAPLEREKLRIETMIGAIDSLALKLEAYILTA
jgi:hypothetical protein